MHETSDLPTTPRHWAVIAGASEGLGAAFATALAAQGHDLVLIARRADALEAVAARLRHQTGREVRCVVADLGAADLADTLLPLAELDIAVAVYDAAFAPIGDFTDQPLARLLQVIHTLAPAMMARGRGGIVLVSSLAGLQGSPRVATYAASKAFNVVLAEALWHELKPVNVVVSIAGAIRTPGYSQAATREAPGTLDPEQVVSATLAALGRGPRVIPGRVNRLAAWVMGLIGRRRAIRIMAVSGEPLRYRFNGLRVLVVAVALWGVLGATGLVPYDQLWVDRWSNLGVACALGLVFSAAVVLPAPAVRSLPVDLFLGRLENPQWLGGRVDAKMFLYLIGAVVLQLNVLSFAAHHFLLYPEDPSVGVMLYVALLTWFLLDYFTFEEVHLYTYDLFVERMGFKLGWGCLTFYPFFYAVGLCGTATLPNPHRSVPYLAMSAVLFLMGWSLARGANLQKFTFKRDPTAIFLGLFPPKTVSDGTKTLLCGGFWGVSRHVNYLGEILMATGIALSLGHPTSPWPWLYPLYYVLLLVPRERDDDARCAARYRPLWQQYGAKVPYRIVPYIY
ncbi:MAG: delta14-sterol reductase [Myxococcota bacterium]|jgi:delta14-sterol reductase